MFFLMNFSCIVTTTMILLKTNIILSANQNKNSQNASMMVEERFFKTFQWPFMSTKNSEEISFAFRLKQNTSLTNSDLRLKYLSVFMAANHPEKTCHRVNCNIFVRLYESMDESDSKNLVYEMGINVFENRDVTRLQKEINSNLIFNGSAQYEIVIFKSPFLDLYLGEFDPIHIGNHFEFLNCVAKVRNRRGEVENVILEKVVGVLFDTEKIFRLLPISQQGKISFLILLSNVIIILSFVL